MDNLRSPIAPIAPETFGQKVWRSVKFYMVVVVILIAWAASSLIVQPALVWTMDHVGAWIHSSTVQTYKAKIIDLSVMIPCDAFEDLPYGCGDGEPDPGVVEYGRTSVLYMWGRLPDLQGLTISDRGKGDVANIDSDGVFYTLQKAWGHLPTGDEALQIARNEMATYGSYTERPTKAGLTRLDASVGSGMKQGNFMALYTRDDGTKVAASCIGDSCKVPQAAWHDGFAYGFTVNKDKAEDLVAIDRAVRARLDGYVKG